MRGIVPALVVVAALGGCATDSQGDRALVGAGLGAATGAAVGGAVSGDVGGAVAGGAVGAATGAIVGAATTPRNCVDRFGRRVPCP